MKDNLKIDLFFDTVSREGLYPNKYNLRFYLDLIYKGIDFKGKNVIDIGGGAGLHSFYAATKGANKVICLEPEADGSRKGVIDKFLNLKNLLNSTNVSLESSTIQSFNSDGEKFDILILHGSINHLNESACIDLLSDENSRAVYHSIFLKLSSLAKAGAKMIICDCSRYNFFATLRVPNLIDPGIEWHKHQSPEVWADMLKDVGFIKPRVKWTSFNSLRNIGRFLFGNKFIAFFMLSTFCLTMENSQ